MDTNREPPDMILRPRRLALQVAAGLVGLLALLGALSVWLRAPAVAAAEVFVRRFGGPGVMLGFSLPESVPVPIPQEIFTGIALIGGMPLWEVTAWALAGSLGGTLVAFHLGRRLGRWPPARRRIAPGVALVERYGTAGLLIAAITPLPWSAACWACGALGMPGARLARLLPVRAARVVFYTWLIDAGWATV